MLSLTLHTLPESKLATPKTRREMHFALFVYKALLHKLPPFINSLSLPAQSSGIGYYCRSPLNWVDRLLAFLPLTFRMNSNVLLNY